MGAFTKAALRFCWVMKIEGYQEEVLEVWVFSIVDTKQILKFWDRKGDWCLFKSPGNTVNSPARAFKELSCDGGLVLLGSSFALVNVQPWETVQRIE